MGKVISMEDRRDQSSSELLERVMALQDRISALRVLGNKEKTLGPFIEADALGEVKDELISRMCAKQRKELATKSNGDL